MNSKLLKELLAAHEECVKWQDSIPSFELVTFAADDMQGAIAGTPFRKFESVPQKRESRRKQNDSLGFDPYVDTLFDYPSITKRTLGSSLDAVKHFNWHLTIHIPYCRMDCWHCYNPKDVCQTGTTNLSRVNGQSQSYTAEAILKRFAQIRKEAAARGEHCDVLRISGGEPFLAPELIAELLEGISVNPDPDYPKLIWTETNLTTWATTPDGRSLVNEAGKVYQEKTGKQLTATLRTHADRIVVHPCFHGLSDENVSECAGIKSGLLQFDDLLTGFRALHGLQMHLYPTFISEASDPDHVENLFESLYALDPAYPLKVALISVDYYPAVMERSKARLNNIPLYGRFACQKRWQNLLKRHYGVDYAQVPRPFVEGVNAFPKPTDLKPSAESHRGQRDASPYQPLLVMLKSDLRPEYRQELLTMMSAPEGTRLRETYDVRHLEPTLAGRLGVETEAFTRSCSRVLLAYANKHTRLTCIPFREATIVRIDVTKSLVSFELLLGPYVVPEVDAGASARTNDTKGKAHVDAFGWRMLDYFGVSHSLGKGGRSAWVLLGEELLLKGWDEGPSFRRLAKGEGNGWGTILGLFAACEGAKSFFSDRNIFLRLTPLVHGPTNTEEEPSEARSLGPPYGIVITEGDKIEYRLSFCIPQFDRYQLEKERDALLSARTLRITTSTASLVVEGYQPRPLAKYGEFDFVLRCSKLENDIPAQVVIEANDQSCYCPRIQLEFLLKKDKASEC